MIKISYFTEIPKAEARAARSPHQNPAGILPQKIVNLKRKNARASHVIETLGLVEKRIGMNEADLKKRWVLHNRQGIIVKVVSRPKIEVNVLTKN